MMKLAALWAWLTSNVLTLAVVAIIGFLVLTKVQSCRDSGDNESAIVMKERIRAGNLRAISDSAALAEKDSQLILALAKGVKVIDHWHDSPPAGAATYWLISRLDCLSHEQREKLPGRRGCARSIARGNQICLLSLPRHGNENHRWLA
jgi:hypothetical protein